MKNIFKIVYYIFLGLIALVGILLVISVFPITGNFKFMTVLSGSMEPAIKTGSIVMVKPVSEYKIGDIITFGKITKTKPPTSHRIMEIKNLSGIVSYTTKGDANNNIDQKEVRQNEIIGKVVFDVPFVGYAIAAARKPYGFILIIVVPALLVIFDEIKKIWDELKKRRDKKKSGAPVNENSNDKLT